jgi:hypothetical protein
MYAFATCGYGNDGVRKGPRVHKLLGAVPIEVGCEPSKLTKTANCLDMDFPTPRTVLRHQADAIPTLELLGEEAAATCLEHYLDFCVKTGVVVDFSIPVVCTYLRATCVAFVDVTKDKMRTVKHRATGMETVIILRKGVTASTASVLLESMGLDELLSNSSLASEAKAKGTERRVVTNGGQETERARVCSYSRGRVLPRQQEFGQGLLGRWSRLFPEALKDPPDEARHLLPQIVLRVRAKRG